MQGEAFNTFQMNSSYPLVYGGDIPSSSFSFGSETCLGGSLDQTKAQGKIIVCYEGFDGYTVDQTIQDLGGAGVIVIGGESSIWEYRIPTSIVSTAQGDAILEYIHGNYSNSRS